MENNEDKAIQEEIIDNLVKKSTELEKRIDRIGNAPITDYSESLNAMVKTLDEIKESAEMDKYLNMLNAINGKLDNLPKQTSKQIRILLFPETNQGQYYKIVFGRLIPWGLAFVISTYIFITGYRAIELYRYNGAIEQSIHYERAWLYLQQHSKKKMLSAMDEAYNKTADNYSWAFPDSHRGPAFCCIFCEGCRCNP